MADAPLIEVTGLSVRLGGTDVLESVDLTVRSREIVTLIGPNGSGKTTLVRAVLGLQEPSAGRASRRAGLRVGYVPQQVHIEDTMPLTVRRFLTLQRRPPRRGPEEALAMVAAGTIANSPIQAISGGEMRRVLLARALLGEPELLVLDEPAAGVDVTGQAALYDLIRALRDRSGCGVLLVSHDLHLVMAATDEVICLNRHVCCRGAPDTVSRHPEFLAMFGKELSSSLAVYAHSHDHDHTLSGETLPAGARSHDHHEHG